MRPLQIAVIGCGLIGRRRARTAAADERTSLRLVVDTDPARAASLAAEYHASAATDWRAALAAHDIDAVVVCTPNALLMPIALEALRAGRHVLLEKPMGRTVSEAERLAAAAARAGPIVKLGFNHRYHPAISRAYEIFTSGGIGRLINMRARYGHGARPGCEQEWRGDRQLAGGGELLDQGVHILDLFHWIAASPPVRVHAELQTAVWPVSPLEDNAFALLRYASGVVAQLHVSMTQWRNLFSWELHGETGALVIEGLTGSYGVQTLTWVRRNLAGGPPDVNAQQYDQPDVSWTLEWSDFVGALCGGSLRHGTPADGLAVMRTVHALYAAAGVPDANRLGAVQSSVEVMP
jgi:predicted dehydrogenase